MLAIKGRKMPEKPQVTRMRRGSLSRAHIYVQHIYTRVSVCERVGGTRGRRGGERDEEEEEGERWRRKVR